MSYTLMALVAVCAVLLVDLAVLRTALVTRKLFWTAYLIVAFFQLITNGILTGRHVVTYDPDAILGARLAYAPVEDLCFGFAMVLLTVSTWVWLGRRSAFGHAAARARRGPDRDRPPAAAGPD